MENMKLEEFTRKYLLEEKYFIVPSRNIGLLMINHIVLKGEDVLNLNPISLERLSYRICERYIEENNILAIDDILGKNLVLSCLKKLEAGKENFFFTKELIDIDTAEEVYKVIMELKSNKIKKFPKEKDLDMIYELYTSELERLNAMDYCDVMLKAAEVKELDDFNKKIIGIASNIEFHNLERDLFNKLSCKKIKIDMPIKQLENLPKEYFFKGESQEDMGKKELSFFNEYGIRNEIDYIIRDIMEKKIALEDLVLAYTDRKYIKDLQVEFKKNNIGIDFSEGLDILSSSSYRFIETLFKFYENYYSLSSIKTMFYNESLNIEKESSLEKKAITQNTMYEELLSLEKADGVSAYEELQDIPSKLASYSKDRREWLREFFSDILFPVFEEELGFNSYIQRLIYLIKKYVQVKTDLDKSAKNEILDTLRNIERIELNIKKEEYPYMILNYIEEIRVLRASTSPGRVFACPYDNAAYTGRKHLYLIGLDSDTVNSEIVESPILLDAVKRDISPSLSFSKEGYKYKKYKIKESLSGNFERISVGYSNFDMVNVKAKTPSNVYMELREEYRQEAREELETKRLLARDLVSSGSALETLGQCSRKLYFERGIGLKEKEEIELDINRWLDPLTRGSLVHEILNIYFDLEKDSRSREKLLNIIEERSKETAQRIPYILEDVYRREKEEIKAYCQAIAEKEDTGSYEVLVNELSFGLEKSNKIFGHLEEQTVMIKDIDLKVKGSIDRVDIDEKNKLIRIIDYKTGSLKNFDEKLRKSSGRGKNRVHDYSTGQKFQFFIYKKALDELLKNHETFKDYSISKFSYEFGDKSIDLDFDEDFLEEIEERIYSLLQIDIFENDKKIVFDESDFLSCKYCEFKNICRTDSEKLGKEVK